MAHDSQQWLSPCPHPHTALSLLELNNTISREGGPSMKILSERRVADAKYSCSYWFSALRYTCRRHLCSIESPDEHPILSSFGSPCRSTPELSSADANISSNHCTRNTHARLLSTAGHVLILSDFSTYPHPHPGQQQDVSSPCYRPMVIPLPCPRCLAYPSKTAFCSVIPLRACCEDSFTALSCTLRHLGSSLSNVA